MVGAILATLVTTTEARAESPEPEPTCSFGWQERIPQSGALLGRPDWGVPVEALVERIDDIVVRWEDGTEVGGAFEIVYLGEDAGYPELLWRPDAPLDRIGTLEVRVVLDNAVNNCDGRNPMPTSTVEVVADPEEPFVPPEPGPLVGVIELTELVCCDGAMPQAPAVEYSARADEVSWAQGYCVLPEPLTPGDARLDLLVSDEEYPGLWIARVLDGDTELTKEVIGRPLYFEYDAPFTARIELVDLASGESMLLPAEIEVPGEVAVEVVDAPDAATVLAAMCEGEPYRCGVEVDEDVQAWSAASCSPWSEEDTEPDADDTGAAPDAEAEGCGCTTDGGDLHAMPLLVLLGVLRRRSART